MDDLLSEDWQKPAAKPTTSPLPPTPSTFASNYSSLRASPKPPQSGVSTPASLSRPSSAVNGSRLSTNDSFGNLVPMKTQKPSIGSQSMLERQKQLLDEKKRQQDEQAQLWDTLGSGRATPEVRQPSPAAAAEDEDDILAAFSKDAPVNRASHFAPPPSSGPVSGQLSGRSTPAISQLPVGSANEGYDEDDDPFGLNQVAHKSNGHAKAPASVPVGNDDDILGDLGKPVTERAAQVRRGSLEDPMIDRGAERTTGDAENDKLEPGDRALAELVEMGFPAETAKIALAENGGNVQNAVGWLLHQAHEESRSKSQQAEKPISRSQSRNKPSLTDREIMPTWMRQEARPDSLSRRKDSRSPANGETDPAQMAQQIGTKFFKSANALWKASQKQMAKTISEFQQEGDPNQPRWMQQPAVEQTQENSQSRKPEQRAPPSRSADVTNEAALLDAPRSRPQKPARPSALVQSDLEAYSRQQSVDTLPQRPRTQPKLATQPPTQPDRRPIAKLSRQEVEDQTEQAYISPARRKRATPKPEPQPEPEVDLFSPAPANGTSVPARATQPQTSKATSAPPVSRPPPAPLKPKAPPRTVPSISPSALSTSTSHRKAGTAHFKLGAYGAAHESYTAALTPLPATHPVAIIVLTNRALTALKTGDAKVAVSDAERALEIIGPNLGVDETIDIGGDEGAKGMREFYGKALMRKAEALEHMEKYADAAGVWRLAVEAGVGGSVSLKGKDRCEKAAAPPKPASTTTAVAAKAPPRNSTSGPGKAPPPKSLGNSLTRPALPTPSASSAEAVKKLRQANAEAERADDEKFALSDAVDARLTAWRGGKTDNLRALLQSMDAVLWEGAGWKKVGMSDLVMPAKVKIVYMKAIAKVHPDKIPQDATIEQRMISAAVFATLNEAWDKFKTDNNL